MGSWSVCSPARCRTSDGFCDATDLQGIDISDLHLPQCAKELIEFLLDDDFSPININTECTQATQEARLCG